MSTKTFFLNSENANYGQVEFNYLQKFFLDEGILNTLGSSWEDWFDNGDLKVTERGAGANMSVDVGAGIAVVGTERESVAFKVFVDCIGTTNLPIAANSSGSNRIDAIILRVSRDAIPNSLMNNVATIEVVLGSGVTALSDGDIQTALGDDDDFIRLANITVPNATADIEDGDITDTRVRAKTNTSHGFAPDVFEFRILASDPDTAVLEEGNFWFNSTNHTVNFWNGTSVIQLGGASTGFNPLKPSAQASPDMTIAVALGELRFGDIPTYYAGGNSGSFTAPATGGHKRIDLLCLSSAGALSIVQGTSTAGSPTAPNYPPGYFVICEVYMRNGMTSIKDTDDSSNGYIYRDARGFTVIKNKFGGTGADGDLSISSGTTTVNLGGAQYYELNYKSISITGTGSLAFSNPHTNGTIIIIKCQGDCTITSSNPGIDTSGMGAAGGTSVATQNTAGVAGSLPTIANGVTQTAAFGPGGATGGGSQAGAIYVSSGSFTRYAYQLSLKQSLVVAAGAGGGSGSVANGGSGTSGAGGRGGGGLYMEIGGAINFTGSIKTNGSNGTAGTGNSGSGGGGGSAGTAVILYNVLVSVAGTMTCTGGAGNTSVNSGYGNSGGGGAGSALAAGGGSAGGSSNGTAGTSGSGGGGTCNFGGTPRTGGAGGTGGASLIAKNEYFA